MTRPAIPTQHVSQICRLVKWCAPCCFPCLYISPGHPLYFMPLVANIVCAYSHSVTCTVWIWRQYQWCDLEPDVPFYYILWDLQGSDPSFSLKSEDLITSFQPPESHLSFPLLFIKFQKVELLRKRNTLKSRFQLDSAPNMYLEMGLRFK